MKQQACLASCSIPAHKIPGFGNVYSMGKASHWPQALWLLSSHPQAKACSGSMWVRVHVGGGCPRNWCGLTGCRFILALRSRNFSCTALVQWNLYAEPRTAPQPPQKSVIHQMAFERGHPSVCPLENPWLYQQNSLVAVLLEAESCSGGHS